MELLVRGGTLLTLSETDTGPVEADIAIDGGRIAGLGPAAELEATFGPADDVIDVSGRHVMPGLANVHTHLFQSAFRGLAAGFRLSDWRARLLIPAYPLLTPDDLYWFTLLGSLENIRSGVTTVVNLTAWPHDLEACSSVARAIGESGLRGNVVKSIGGRAYDGIREDTRDSLQREVADVFGHLHGTYGGRIRIVVGPSRPSYAPIEWLRDAHEVATTHGSGVHTHLGETKEDTAADAAKLGMSEAAYLETAGVLDDRFQGAHCVWLDRTDAEILARHNATAVHCPVSNLYLGSGVADLVMQQSLGLNIALGADGPASNNNQDMFAVMKLASLLQKGVHRNASLFPARDTLRMATSNGTVSSGVDAGVIEVGRRADLAVVDLSGTHNQPLHDPYSAIVYSAHSSDVESVIVDGKVVMERRVVRGQDEGIVIGEATVRARAIAARIGLA